jgi:hypothetical protein
VFCVKVFKHGQHRYIKVAVKLYFFNENVAECVGDEVADRFLADGHLRSDL